MTNWSGGDEPAASCPVFGREGGMEFEAGEDAKPDQRKEKRFNYSVIQNISKSSI
jgi:hypothetical protein